MDLYMQGKLVKSVYMPGVARVDPNSPVFITPTGGFSGWTAQFKYFANSISPQDAYSIYRKGYGNNLLGSLFGSKSLKISVITNDVETNSVTI
jgi:hypothetical protein